MENALATEILEALETLPIGRRIGYPVTLSDIHNAVKIPSKEDTIIAIQKPDVTVLVRACEHGPISVRLAQW